MHDFDLTGELSLKIELHMLIPITEKVHSGNGPVSLVDLVYYSATTRYYAITMHLLIMHDFDLTGELSLKIELHMLRPITEKVHSGNGPVSLVDLVYYSATTRYYAITMHFKRKVIVFSSSWRFLLNLSSL